jgi:tetratricopeptide (TPR) repeat protein
MAIKSGYYRPMLCFNRFPLFALLLVALGANAQSPGVNAAPGASALDAALFYQLLLGELEAGGGEPGAAYSLILDAARKTHDAALYQRAVDVALEARSGDSALSAARAWRQAIPASKDANRYVLRILIGLNRIGETLEPLKREIAAADAAQRAATIAALPRYFAYATDKKLVEATVERALADDLTGPATGAAAWSAVGRLRLDAGNVDGAIEAARRAQAIDVKSEPAARLALSLMSAKVPQAEALLKQYLEKSPTPEVRMDYARVLLDAQRYADALLQLQVITTEQPDYPPGWLIRGVIELQDGKLDAAEISLKRYVVLAQLNQSGTPLPATARGLTQAYLSLAQIAEKRKNFSEADAWLARIDNAEDLFTAQLRRANILARQGKLEQALELVRSQPEKSPADARLKIDAEVQLLRDGKHFKEAHLLLASAVAGNPDDLDLVYELAMVAEKLGNLEEMEQLLRRVIAAQPERPHAYNALGYSLADRQIRLPEARQLILKALEFAPGDPFIRDSLGWLEFRSGNLAQAQRILEGAFKERPDAEIAAHLGEVLWAMDQHETAVAVWKEGVQLNAENETLVETLKRLRVKL